jgi:hypothetical protein
MQIKFSPSFNHACDAAPKGALQAIFLVQRLIFGLDE